MTGDGAAARGFRPLFLLLLPVQAALMAGMGVLVTGPMADLWPLSVEESINRDLAARRSAAASTASAWLSVVASTEGVIAITAGALIILLALPRAPLWADGLFLSGSVLAQSSIFLLVTLLIDRPRPDVPQLEPSPPTSSFPSGHVGASTALFGGLAALAVVRLRGPWGHTAAVAFALVPFAVAASRLYAGMHHPTDVAAGLLNGGCTLLVMFQALAYPKEPTRMRPLPEARGRRAGHKSSHPACGDAAERASRGAVGFDAWLADRGEREPARRLQGRLPHP